MAKLTTRALRKLRKDKLKRLDALIRQRYPEHVRVPWHVAHLAEMEFGQRGLVRAPFLRWRFVYYVDREAAAIAGAFHKIREEKLKKIPGKWLKKDIPEYWVEVSTVVAARLRSVQLEDIALKKDTQGLFWAPYWARTVCEIDGLGERARSAVLKRAAFDKTSGSVLSSLLASISEDEVKLRVIKEVVNECAQTIICPCGQKFESPMVWRHHTETTCPGAK